MALVEVRGIRAGDVHAVAAGMRQADRDEVWRSIHARPHAALAKAVWCSDEAWCAAVDGVPACLFGVARGAAICGSGFGVPWLLGTDLVTRHARALLRLAPACVAGWRDRYGRLVNFVDVENGAALRFLRRLGARVEPAVPWGRGGEPFHPFEL